MKRKFLTFYILALLPCIFTMCEGRQTTKARIVERKQVSLNKLMIKYVYFIDNQKTVDSAVINNQVLKNDTIVVLLNNNNQQKSVPQVEK